MSNLSLITNSPINFDDIKNLRQSNRDLSIQISRQIDILEKKLKHLKSISTIPNNNSINRYIKKSNVMTKDDTYQRTFKCIKLCMSFYHSSSYYGNVTDKQIKESIKLANGDFLKARRILLNRPYCNDLENKQKLTNNKLSNHKLYKTLVDKSQVNTSLRRSERIRNYTNKSSIIKLPN